MPGTGVLSVTVPGVVDGWSELLSKYGTLPLAQALAPAIDYARNGYAVSEIISGQWKASEQKLARRSGRPPRRSCPTATRRSRARSSRTRSWPRRSS